jgi:hypothetical protein
MIQRLIATEYDECRTFVDWTQRVRFRGKPLFERIVHVPNERDRHRGKGNAGVHVAKLKAIGVRQGFPDYIVLAHFVTCPGLYLEAKRSRGSKIDPAQIAWRDQLIEWGYEAVICKGADELIKATDAYFRCHAAEGEWVNRFRFW